MEFDHSNHYSKSKQALPPKRGEIKAKIFKAIVKSAAGILAKSDGSKRRDGGSLVSPSTTPHETPSGFNSDDDFEG